MLSVKERKKRQRKKYLLIAAGILWASSLIFLFTQNEFEKHFQVRQAEREIPIGQQQYEGPVTEKEELLRMMEDNDIRFLGLEDIDPALEDEPLFNDYNYNSNGISLDDPEDY